MEKQKMSAKEQEARHTEIFENLKWAAKEIHRLLNVIAEEVNMVHDTIEQWSGVADNFLQTIAQYHGMQEVLVSANDLVDDIKSSSLPDNFPFDELSIPGGNGTGKKV